MISRLYCRFSYKPCVELFNRFRTIKDGSRPLCIALGAAVLCSLIYSTALFSYRAKNVYVFRSFKSVVPEKMRLVGRIQSKGRESFARESSSGEYDIRKNQVIVKLFESGQIRVGQILYVINAPYKDSSNAMVIGEIKVSSIFTSSMYGLVFSARGNLFRVRAGHFVARKMIAERLQRAFIVKRKGDRYAEQVELNRAISYYQEALSIAPSLPEAHVGLAKAYIQKHKALGLDEFPSSALNHYEQAWEYRSNFHYQQEQLAYYLDFMNLLNLAYESKRWQSNRSHNIIEKYLERILVIGEEALQVQRVLGSSPSLSLVTILARVHYYRMLAYAGQASPEERRHYDHSMQKADFWLKQALAREYKSGELIRVAILFYGYRYKQLQINKVADPELLAKMRAMLLQKLKPYYSLYLDPKKETRDPKVDQLLESL